MSKSKRTVSKRQAIRERRRQQQQRQRLITILIIGVIAIIIAGLLALPTIRQALTPVGEIVTIIPNPRPMANFNAMGDPNAPVKIKEYSDFQCPFCRRFSEETEPQIVDNYVATGKVFFEYISFGPAGRWIGPESKAAAKAAYCAGDQNKFWEYHDTVFANQTGENLGDFTDKRLEAIAEALNLNLDEFNACFNNSKYEDRLKQDLLEGVQAGISSTPSFLINGKLLVGAQPFSMFQQEIEAALAAASNN